MLRRRSRRPHSIARWLAVPASARQDCANPLHSLVGQRGRFAVGEGPIHRIVGTRDESIQRHRAMTDRAHRFPPVGSNRTRILVARSFVVETADSAEIHRSRIPLLTEPPYWMYVAAN